MRILGVALEVAAVHGAALDVDGGREQHAGALGQRFLRNRAGDAAHECRIEARAERDADRKGRSREPADQPATATRAVRTVADLDRRDAQPLDRHGRPEVGAGKQRDLLF
jgi:hypothetical protein